MPKIIIEFDKFEEASELRHALDGDKYHAVLWDLDQFLRSNIKYADESAEVTATYQKVRTHLKLLLDDLNLSIYE